MDHQLPMQDAAASPSADEDYLVVGRIGKPHGVNGDVHFHVLTGFPERLVPGKRIFVGEEKAVHVIVKIRGAADRLIVALDGLSDRDQAALLRSQFVFVPLSEVPDLPDGEFYHHQLLGMRVQSDDGRDLGELVDILETGANDVFVARSDEGAELLLPVIDDVILEIDSEAGVIRVHLIDGL